MSAITARQAQARLDRYLLDPHVKLKRTMPLTARVLARKKFTIPQDIKVVGMTMKRVK